VDQLPASRAFCYAFESAVAISVCPGAISLAFAPASAVSSVIGDDMATSVRFLRCCDSNLAASTCFLICYDTPSFLHCRELLPQAYVLLIGYCWSLQRVLAVIQRSPFSAALLLCRELLPQAYQQPGESQKYSDLENTTTFGVAARRKRDNDPAVHSNQDMFSCGSLSARFSTERLVRSDGCNDYGFAR
jgi:hypothetical protein